MPCLIPTFWTLNVKAIAFLELPIMWFDKYMLVCPASLPLVSQPSPGSSYPAQSTWFWWDRWRLSQLKRGEGAEGEGGGGQRVQSRPDQSEHTMTDWFKPKSNTKISVRDKEANVQEAEAQWLAHSTHRIAIHYYRYYYAGWAARLWSRNNYPRLSGICQYSRCTHGFPITPRRLPECKLYIYYLICSLMYPRYLK